MVTARQRPPLTPSIAATVSDLTAAARESNVSHTSSAPVVQDAVGAGRSPPAKSLFHIRIVLMLRGALQLEG